MSLQNERELIASRKNLRQLENKVAELKAQDPRSRATELSMQFEVLPTERGLIMLGAAVRES